MAVYKKCSLICRTIRVALALYRAGPVVRYGEAPYPATFTGLLTGRLVGKLLARNHQGSRQRRT